MAQAAKLDPDVTEALACFGLSGAGRVEHLRTLNNAVYLVRHPDGSPEWVLRRHRSGGREAAAIRAELGLLTYLADQLPDPFTVPRPGAGPQGDHLVTVNGLHYSLLGWISGTPRRPDTGLDAEGARLLGAGLATIHAVLDQYERPTASVEWNAVTLFTEHPGLLGADPARLDDLVPADDRELVDEVADRAGAIFDETSDWGLIHADFILGNCHWATAADRTTLGILDFDDFGHGPRLFDLGAVLGNLADYSESWNVNAAALLHGYREIRPLPADAERDLPMMMAARHTSHCLWALGHRDLGDDWIASHVRARLAMARTCLAVEL